MNRREFLKAAALAGMSLATFGCLSQEKPAPIASSPAPVKGTVIPPLPFDLTVVHGTDPAGMIERGFKAIGGIETYVKKGFSVVIKPNVSVPSAPEEAATTNTIMVATLVKMCLAAGAKEVKVVDQPLNSAAPAFAIERTGIKKAVEEAKGKMLTYNGVQEAFQKVDIPGAKIATSVEYAKDVLAADLFINFPILKQHNGTKLTLSMKNLMGLIEKRGYFHANGLLQCIADLASFNKPHLTIMDAYRGITANGPKGPGPIKEYGQLIFGTDMVAIDAYAAALFGLKPAEVGYIQRASEMGLGEINWEKLKLQKV